MTEHIFKTWDINIAAMLFLNDVPLKELVSDPGGPGTSFAFEDGPRCLTLYDMWKEYVVKGNLREYLDARETMKAMRDEFDALEVQKRKAARQAGGS